MERLTNLSTDNWGVRGLNHLFRIAADNGYTVAVGSLLAAATEYNTALHHAAWGGHHGPVAIRPRDRHRGPWLRQADTVAQSFMARTRGHDWAAARPRGRHRGQGFRALDAAANSYLERIWGNDWVAAWPRGRHWGRGSSNRTHRTHLPSACMDTRPWLTERPTLVPRAADPEIAAGGYLERMRGNGWAAA